jgi:hypothetical protein
VRDLHLRHTLTTLARDASAVFTDLVAGGQEIPYEIADPGDGFAFCQYRPLTAKFVRDNATELRELDSFREATETLRRTDLAAGYLEEAGITPPADSVERSTLAVTYFLARLWDGCSDFEIEDERFAAVLGEVEECSEPEAGEVEAIVPLVGFVTDAPRIELKGASIVRADTVDCPPEAGKSDRPVGAGWEPTFLISARVSLDDERGLAGAGDRVAKTFERVVTTLRLYKAGGVGLGPHGWVRVSGDRWRRISTGAGRPRPGGYRLAEEDVAGLVELSRTVSVHPKRVTRLRRSLLRFESGLDRRGAIDALNDHLLALRFVLEGEGPAGVGLPMRAAALASEGEERTQTKELVEQAISLERELWSGEPTSQKQGVSPSEVAAGIERLLRTILRHGVSGELGSDLRAAADEMLLADGLSVGEGAGMQSETEWEISEPESEPALSEELAEAVDPNEWLPQPAAEEAEVAEAQPEPDAEEVLDEAIASAEAFDRFERDPEPLIRASRPEPLPRPSQIVGEDTPEARPEPVAARAEVTPEPVPAEPMAEADEVEDSYEDESMVDEVEPPNWLAEVGAEDSVTMSFPKRPEGENHLDELSRPPMEREEVRARVEYLFPRTETDWDVGGQAPRRAQAG